MSYPEFWLGLSPSSPGTWKEVSVTPILQRTLQLREDSELPRIVQGQWQNSYQPIGHG